MIPLDKYFKFISKMDKNEYILNEDIFLENIRDYQGKNQVNKGIEETLREIISKNKPSLGYDFWWANNGVTIVADEIHPSSQGEFLLSNPQIINGMQTSYSLHRILSKCDDNDLHRASEHRICIRAIQAKENTRIRNLIIKGSNSQTAVSKFSLYANLPIHIDLEEYFTEHIGEYELYYERRKKYYTNRKVNSSKVISIDYLAQGVGALIVGKPHSARSGKTELIQKNYDSIYIDNYSDYLDVYHWVARIHRFVELYLKNKKIPNRNHISTADAQKLLFYIPRFYAILKKGNKLVTFDAIKDFINDDIFITEGCIEYIIQEISSIINQEMVEKGDNTFDNIVKSSNLTDLLDCKAYDLSTNNK